MVTVLLLALPLLALAGPATGQAVPASHFPGLTLEPSVGLRLATGAPVELAGRLDDEGLDQVLFSFSPQAGGADVDFFIGYVHAGRFARTVVFDHDQAGPYDLTVYAGRRGELLSGLGTYRPIEVSRGSGAFSVPEAYFDGLRLDLPLPAAPAVGVAVTFRGQALDPAVRELRLDLEAADGTARRSVPVALADGRFDAVLRLRPDETGLTFLTAVAGLADDTYWGRGTFGLRPAVLPSPSLELGVLGLNLLPGTPAAVPVSNRGDAALEIRATGTEGPFRVTAAPGTLAPGQRGEIRVLYDGAGGDDGFLVVTCNDPLRATARVALAGLSPAATARPLRHQRADGDGVIRLDLDFDVGDYALALYSGQLDGADTSAVYRFGVGEAPPLARPARPSASPTARDLAEATLRARERQLARRVQERGLPARRPAAAAYRPGDRRTFVFDAFPPVPRQLVPARVVATNDRAVALVDEGWYDADPQAPAAARLQEVIDQFARDYDRAAAAFGTPSDVDGDGRIAFLFTPLVAQVGIAGFQDPGSALPESVGGNGNLTDLLFLSPAGADRSFRSLLVHEFQHLINFHQHVLLRGGPAEASWLNEGLSHVSEDLVEGFTDGGNALLVQAYLAEPGAVGLEGNALMDLRKRGAAYLFVRSLVDRLGEGVLPRLVQSGLADRDNLEAALGEPFGELLAFWSAQVYASGTELAGPSRFEYAFGYLRSPSGRGFPMPATLLYREGGPGIAGDLRPRGANYVRLSGSGRRAVEVRVDRDAAAGATIFPLPRGFVPPVAIPAGYFADLALAPALPGELATGEALAIAGQLDRPGADRLALVFTPAAGGQATTYYLPVAGGRFERAVVFDHSEAGEYDLALFAGPTGGTLGYLGRFWPVRIRAGAGAVRLPAAYFNGLRLDGPLPALVLPGAAVPLAGRALDPAATTVLFRLVDTAGQQRTGQYLDVVAGRFEGSLSTSGLDLGTYQIEAYLGDAELAYAGGFPFFRVAADLPTAVTAAAALPAALGLEQNYPNPFNSDTVIPFRLPGPAATPVELVLFDALGQRVAVLAKGLLEPGLHEARWDGRDAAGRAAASGVYLYRLTAGRQVAVRHLALTR